ncbi:hypothetical protein RvVAR0630_15940 [Agrobacterium vitis]|nr:hypothetical protein RvVAR0630_15940 [Agrobacterium vitis]
MRLCRMMALVALAATASGCSTNAETPPVVKTVYVERDVPAAAKLPCDPPVPLPDRRLSEPESASYWGTDRTALRACEARRAAAVSGGTHAQ